MLVEIRLANAALADLHKLRAWYDREGVLAGGPPFDQEGTGTG